MKLHNPSGQEIDVSDYARNLGERALDQNDELLKHAVDFSNVKQDDYFTSKAHPYDPRRLRLQYQAIGDIADKASSGMDFAKFCYYVTRIIAEVTEAYGAVIFLYSKSNGLVTEVGRYSSITLPNIQEQYVFPITAGRLGRVMVDNKIIVFGPNADHEDDLPPETLGISPSYGITVPISDGIDILGSYVLLFERDNVRQSADFLITLSKVLASHIKLMERAQLDEFNPSRSQLAIQILNSIENAIGPLAARSGVEQQKGTIAAYIGTDKPAIVTELSRDDVELLVLIAEGYSNDAISGEMHLSESAVKKRVSALMRKLDMDSRVQLCAYAFRSGFVE